MDPFSIAAGCVAFSEAVIKTIPCITSFIHAIHGARQELDRICKQLRKLDRVLNQVQQAIGPKENTPDNDRDYIFSIINQCLGGIDSINMIINDHTGRLGPSRWAIYGKEKCQLISKSLDESIRDLSLVLQAHQSMLSNRIEQKHDHSTLQSDLIQKDIGTILGDTDYLKRHASEQTDILATLSQKFSDFCSLINPNTMRPLEEPIYQDSYGNERTVSSDSDSIVRDLHCYPIENDDNHLMENFVFNVCFGPYQSFVAEPPEWQVKDCSYVSSGNLVPYAEGPATPCQKPSMAIKPLEKPVENSIVAKIKADVHAKARAANSKDTPILRSSSTPQRWYNEPNGSLRIGHSKRRSMVVDEFQRKYVDSFNQYGFSTLRR